MKTGSTSRRFDELDSVRGLAALSVMFWHFAIIFPVISADTLHRGGYAWLNLLKYTPLHAVFAGRQAVITFFVLSGFVLSIPFYGSRPPTYRDFVIKRICRIYIPYIVAVSVGAVLLLSIARGDIPDLSIWVNGIWRSGLSLGLITGHVSLIGSFNNGAIDPVIWSLVHEMRVSLIFPLLMVAVIRLDWRASIGASLVLSMSSLAFIHVMTHVVHYSTDYFDTLQYIVLFVAGALLCRHREALVARYRALPRVIHYLWLPVALTVYTYPYFPPQGGTLHLDPVNISLTGLGASMMILAALGSPLAGRFLRLPPLLFLGRVSYSFYLYHAIILLAMIKAFYGTVPLAMLLIGTAVLAVAIATLSYYLVEVPGIALGKRLTRRREPVRETAQSERVRIGIR